jgi:hypothetical protein
MLAIVLLIAGAASAQTTMRERLDATSAHMKRLQSISARLPADAQDKLSAGAQHLLHMAQQWDQIEQAVSRAGVTAQLTATPFRSQSGGLDSSQVSDPSTDLKFSRMGGFTQSETSTAWCGRNVVVAFNDSGSFMETFPIPHIGLSFSGYSLSTDGGRSFTDRGYLNPGPSIDNFIGGDPVVVCTSESIFYQSSIFSSNFGDTGVSVSKSTDGGKTFGDPVEVVSKAATFVHFLDKPWMAADPSNPRKLYVTYTDVDFSGFYFSNTVCPHTIRFGIELVSSTDAGATWSAPTVIDKGCYPNFDQGSNVAVDGAGNVYVAWEQLPASSITNEIDIAKSTDGGATFGSKSVVAIVVPVGGVLGLLQGGFRNNEFPSLAIDLSSGGRGPLYVAWNDGNAKRSPEPPFFSSTYNFGDAVVSRSDNGGLSWSAKVRVNDDSSNSATGPGADHYLPGIAVDRNGDLGVCYYDRRRDPNNFHIDRECAASRDGGQSWKNHRVTRTSFAASIAADQLINRYYMGDYDGVAVDFLGQTDGFLGAFGDNTRGNPDVRISKRFGGADDSGNDD